MEINRQQTMLECDMQCEEYLRKIQELKKENHRYKDAFNKAHICNEGMQKEIDRLRKENENLMELLGVTK